MDLEKYICIQCNTEFEEGNLALKTDKGYVHYADSRDFTALANLLVCNAQYSQGSVCLYHNNKFYNLEEHSEHLVDVNVDINVVQDVKGHVRGQTIIGDLSFLDNLKYEK